MVRFQFLRTLNMHGGGIEIGKVESKESPIYDGDYYSANWYFLYQNGKNSSIIITNT